MAYDREEPKSLLILAIGVGSLITIAGSIWGLQSYFQMMREEEQFTKYLGVESPAKKDHRAEMNRVLTSYAKLDANGSKVRIPIDDAMKAFVAKGRDAFPGIKIDPTTVTQGGAAAPAASSAAPATSAPAPATSGSSAPAPGHH